MPTEQSLRDHVIAHWQIQRWNRFAEPAMRLPELEEELRKIVENLTKRYFS